MKKNNLLVASAVAIMLAPAALATLPQQTVNADAVGTIVKTTTVYDANGKATKATLATGTQWKLGQQKTLNGVVNYMVGTNQYVPATALTNVTGSANPEDNTQTADYYTSANPDAGKTATAKVALHVVDVYGNETGTILPVGSQWKIGVVLHANKMTYYKVGNNQFISTLDVNVAGANNSTTTTPTTKPATPVVAQTGTMNSTASIYGSDGKPLGLTLPQGSQWKLGTKVTIGGTEMYPVATNEYVPAVFVNVAGSTVANNNANSVVGKTGTIKFTAYIVTADGTQTSTSLATGTQWKLGSTININGVPYYQVGGNEYISAANFTVSDSTTTNTGATTGTSTATNPNQQTGVTITSNPNAGQIGTAKTGVTLVDDNGKATNNTVSQGSQWKLGRIMHANNQTYYQIGGSEWIAAASVTIGSPATSTTTTNTNTSTTANTSNIPTVGNGLTATTTAATKTYDTSSNTAGAELPVATYKITKLVVNKYGSYWGQISTNQWVWISSVTLNSGLNLQANSYLEPEFATHISK